MTAYRIIALVTGAILLIMAGWVLFLAPQPVWVKVVGLPPLLLAALLFLDRARRGPPSN